MAEDSEMESIVSTAANTGSETGVVEVKFEKNPYQAQKYLEAEPKALGVTQIMLSIFAMSTIFSTTLNSFPPPVTLIYSIFSIAKIIAGSVAIAAQNLHLPTLKACLGMEILACVFSVICFFLSTSALVETSIFHLCWDNYHNGTSFKNLCDTVWSISVHMRGIELLIQATQVALSATLAAYCCKVIQCCSPKTNVPVIVVNQPPGPQ